MSLRSPVPRGGLGVRGEDFPGGERVAELLGKVGLCDEPAGGGGGVGGQRSREQSGVPGGRALV